MGKRLSFAAYIGAVLLAVWGRAYGGHAYAAERPVPRAHSVTQTGTIGLVSAPTARMYQTGTIWAGSEVGAHYTHGFIGAQLSEAFSVTLRHSPSHDDTIFGTPRLAPGIDMKLRLLQEGAYRPALAIGVQNIHGAMRTPDVYTVLSKRYENWDAALGFGWGGRIYESRLFLDRLARLAAGDASAFLPNTQDTPPDPSPAFFAGVEYFTPFKGVSLKADVGADRFMATPKEEGDGVSWAGGLNYKTALWGVAEMDASVSVYNAERIRARLTFSRLLQSMGLRPVMPKAVPLAGRRRSVNSMPPDMARLSAEKQGIVLRELREHQDKRGLSAVLDYNPLFSLPQQMGKAFSHMAKYANAHRETLTLLPQYLGLTGRSVRIRRSDLEGAHSPPYVSADEIWHNAEIGKDRATWSNDRHAAVVMHRPPFIPVHISLDQHISMAGQERTGHAGPFLRSSVLGRFQEKTENPGVHHGVGLRLNLGHNLDEITEGFRRIGRKSAVTQSATFADHVLYLDHIYTAGMHSFSPSWHVAMMAGYLDERYFGWGAELLYRPFGRRFAVKAEGFFGTGRDADSFMGAGVLGQERHLAELTTYYDIPGYDLTLTASGGLYLAEDKGFRVGVEKRFKNGVKLSGYLGFSDTDDLDVQRGIVASNHGLRLTFPLGQVKGLPQQSSARIMMEPFGRIPLQTLDKAIDLYELTTPLSLPHIARHWDEIIAPLAPEAVSIQP